MMELFFFLSERRLDICCVNSALGTCRFGVGLLRETATPCEESIPTYAISNRWVTVCCDVPEALVSL